MKSRAIILLFTIATLFVSCNNDDDATNDLSLIGEWNLINVSGGVGGLDIDYDRGWIVWNFNEDMVLIENNSPIDNGPITQASGTYTYTIISANDKNFLVLDGQEKGQIIFENDSFTIDQNEYSTGSGNDGFGIYFER